VLKSEQKLEDMVDVMEDFHEYVPTVTTSSEYELSGSEDVVNVTLDAFHYMLFGE
jgi:hypothetical protein